MRLVGGCLLAAALSLFLLSRLRREEESLRLLSALLSFIRELREKIAVFGTPLDEILEGYTDPVLDGCGFLSRARRVGLSEAGEALRKEGRLPPSLSSELMLFFTSLGKGFREEEVQRCGAAEALLARERDAALPALEKNRKLTRALILTGSLFILIILW